MKGFKEDDLVVAYRHEGFRHGVPTKKVVQFDVSSLRKFVCSPGVDPVSVAGMDECEYIVDSILQHRLQGTNKKSKTQGSRSVQYCLYTTVKTLRVYQS